LPPAFAARLRAVLPAPEDDLLLAAEDDLLAAGLRALDEVERRLDELLELELERPRPPDPPLAVDLRAPPEELEDFRALDPPEPRALEDDLRALEPRALDPEDLRAPEPPPDLFRDDPPPLPEPDSAIALPPLKLCAPSPARCGRDYLMPSAEVTYA
jgi:hypothetical protein